MCRELTLERVSLGGPVFDVQKLRWLNARYIREDHTSDSLHGLLEAWALGRENVARLVPLVQPRLETLADWGRLTGPFFADEIELDPADLAVKDREPGEVAGLLQLTLWRLEAQPEFSAATLKALFAETAEALGMKLKGLALLFYVALSGSKAWTPLFESMEILGPDMVRARARRAIEALGGLSSKKRKELEKRYAELFGRRD
jgi:glutamyl-tRNA synthetase